MAARAIVAARYSTRARKTSAVKEDPKINSQTTQQNTRKKREHVAMEYEETPNDSNKNVSVTLDDDKRAKWEPNNWMKIVENIREMRKERDAPVDTMGCDMCMDETGSPKACVCNRPIQLSEKANFV